MGIVIEYASNLCNKLKPFTKFMHINFKNIELPVKYKRLNKVDQCLVGNDLDAQYNLKSVNFRNSDH